MKSLLVFAMALLLLVPLGRTVLAAPANSVSSNTRRELFKGTMQSEEAYSTISNKQYITGNGSGESEQLHAFKVSYHVEVNLSDLSETESVQFAGSNGDSLQAKGKGLAIEDRTPGMYNVVEVYNITGGTGRFEGASGAFTVKRLVSRTVGISTSTFEGYILLP